MNDSPARSPARNASVGRRQRNRAATRNTIVDAADVIVDVKCPQNVEIKSPLKKARRCTLGGMR